MTIFGYFIRHLFQQYAMYHRCAQCEHIYTAIGFFKCISPACTDDGHGECRVYQRVAERWMEGGDSGGVRLAGSKPGLSSESPTYL